MGLQASVELDSEHEVLQAQLAEAYGAALAEQDREIAERSARLADAGNGGPPALTALQERLSYRLRNTSCRCRTEKPQQRQTWYTSRTSEFLQPERRMPLSNVSPNHGTDLLLATK